MTETQVIEHYSARYAAEFEDSGAQLEECYAVPGNGVWITVICGSCALGRYREYNVNRLGRFVHGGDMACADEGLKT
ncbi:hypothetical protein [Shimia abyssi]|nr:hypothetical protein [Shimia abyssi]